MSTKKHILALLESKRGQNISGEYIAEQLSISRNAVWKAVKELEKDGYKIKAVTNRGYCLCEDNDILSVQGMMPFLSHGKISEKICVYDSLESTNKTAKGMALSGAEHGTIIIADTQTSGRGRYGRSFYSPSGHGIYMSFILCPAQLGFNTPTLVTSFAAIAVCEAIETISDKVPQIKWVNDIFIGNKKVCGILTEAVMDFESGNIEWVVVGIGINFSTGHFPDDLSEIAGAIFTESNPPITRNRLVAEIVDRIVFHDNQHGIKEMLKKYKQRLFMLEKIVCVVHANEKYEAVAIDIDDVGRLIVRRKSGEVIALNSGEISIVTR